MISLRAILAATHAGMQNMCASDLVNRVHGLPTTLPLPQTFTLNTAFQKHINPSCVILFNKMPHAACGQ